AEYRTERLGRQMQEMIGALVLEGKIKDPRVSPFVSITRVNVSRDLSFADVYVSNVRGTANIDQCAQGLQSASGFIRSKLGSSLHIRKIPHLRFYPDTSVSEGFDMIQKIGQLVGDSPPPPDEGL
ncbi:MAG: 30S ribosome-binding factor RbfA, partial [Treponema sp.]|nr:30S ribosome-binding factor RbfA [Treponema sp.]